jgi:hypothetical protein
MIDKNSRLDEGLKEMLKNPVFEGKTIVKNMLPVKQSTVILDFAKPILDKIDMSNKSLLERKIKSAVEVWNSFIVIEKASETMLGENKHLQKLALAGSMQVKLVSRISRKDYYTLLKRKEELYPDNQHYIIEYNILWSDDDSEFSLSVITNDASNIDIGD